MKILVLLLQEFQRVRIKIERTLDLEPGEESNSMTDMQPIMVASDIFVHHKWWKIYRIQDIQYSRMYVRKAVEYSRRTIIKTLSTPWGLW